MKRYDSVCTRGGLKGEVEARYLSMDGVSGKAFRLENAATTELWAEH